MWRRRFIAGLSALLLAASAGVRAQGARRPLPRIGVLTPSRTASEVEDLVRELEMMGYVQGRSVAIERRSADGMSERFPELAAELVRLRVDVIVALGSEATQAAKQATSSIPIVFTAGDPVGEGFVQTLAHPGGNLTGVAYQIPELAAKALQLLKEVVPQSVEIGIFWSPNNANEGRFLREAEKAAPQLGLSIQGIAVPKPGDLPSALGAAERVRLRALIVLGGNMFDRESDSRVVEFAIVHRIAAISVERRFVDRGLLMFYGPASAGDALKVTSYVDKILKGAKPADLPVDQATRFELVINLKTAKALGLTMPQPLLLRANELIQ